MDLTEEQKSTVATWVRDGVSLSDVQKRIQSEFGVALTYMDVRFLVDDLDLELSDRPPEHFAQKADDPAGVNGAGGPANAPAGAGGPSSGDADILDADGSPASAAGGGGKVQVSLDQVNRPGALVSGNVTFSDGVSAQWQLDQMGRLSLSASQPGYKPSQDDVMQFQTELQRLVEQRGGF